jgi:hypothetical protein
MDVFAFRTFKGPKIGVGGTRFDAGKHHAAVTLGAVGPFDWQERWLGTDMELGHVMHSLLDQAGACRTLCHRWDAERGCGDGNSRFPLCSVVDSRNINSESL